MAAGSSLLPSSGLDVGEQIQGAVSHVPAHVVCPLLSQGLVVHAISQGFPILFSSACWRENGPSCLLFLLILKLYLILNSSITVDIQYYTISGAEHSDLTFI